MAVKCFSSLLFRHTLCLVLACSLSAKFCDRNPRLIQCRALKLQNILPRRSDCHLLWHKKRCTTGDLVSKGTADCVTKFSGNSEHSLVSGFKVGYSYRCFPGLKSAKSIHLRNVATSYGEPQCMPVETKPVVCGERGTRCVCDAPAWGWDTSWLNNECRCQYFVDLCKIRGVCQHKNAQCKTWGSELQCKCRERDIWSVKPQPECSLGINQCIANPGLCEDEGKLCVELYDENKGWTIGSEVEGSGFTCISKNVARRLRQSTSYCYMHLPVLGNIKRVENIKPRDDVDMCCYRILTCAGGNTKRGTIFSYRPCYCFVEFRKCLIQLQREPMYRAKVQGIVKVLNAIFHCEMDDGSKCNPSRPWTCRKGDLINPTIAHCTIDCRTGPLLPIWERKCSKRQCTPPHYSERSLIVDVPAKEESSVCKPVKNLPIECGRGGSPTRCVCEANPTVTRFTDRCRCQFWPRRWGEFFTTPAPSKPERHTNKP